MQQLDRPYFVKLPGVSEKEARNTQQTHLGVYWRRHVQAWGSPVQKERAEDGASSF